MNLPPLPKPFMELHREISPAVYDAWQAQMTAYAAEAVRVALERAAQVAEAACIAACDSFGDGAECIATGERCAEAIRALKEQA